MLLLSIKLLVFGVFLMISKDTRRELWNNTIIGTHTELLGEHSFCIEGISAEDSSLLMSCQESLYI